ncbi:MAG: lysophospholipase [Treponemataceae bacterium]|nr:lysophospholipase [Treponemataceae bacterium]
MKSRSKVLKKVVFWAVIGLFAALLIVVSVFTSNELKKNFGRGSYRTGPYSTNVFFDYYQDDYSRRPVSFMSGKNKLNGWVYNAENPKGTIVFAHGIGGGHENYISLILGMVDRGWQVFAYDATGSCSSEGEGTVGLVQSALDLDKALTFAENDPELSALPIFVMGHSWGGFASAAVLNFKHDVKAVVSMSGYYKATAQLLESSRDMFGGWAYLLQPFVAMSNFFTFGKYAGLSAVDGINKAGIPVLVTHGTDDEIIGFDTSSIISQQKKITNPSVQYFVYDQEGRNRHSTFMNTEEKIAYAAEKNSILDQMREDYGGDIPDDILIPWFDNLDKDILNQTHAQVMDMADRFFSGNRE